MMPIPFQMLPSGITAYLTKVNIPAAISVVWVTNPLTWPLILYWQYRLGLVLMGGSPPPSYADDSIVNIAASVPTPLLLGCVVTGLISAATSYILVNLAWDVVVTRWWRSHLVKNQRKSSLR
jgi:uncharacterized protein (DUF2062 family)